MKVQKQSYKPTKVVEGYQMKKQQRGGFKIIEYWRMSNEESLRKRTLYKNLNMMDAENILYQLESKLPK